MVTIQCEILYKIYANGTLTRSNICHNDSQWAQVDFNLNSNKRLISVDSSMVPRTDFAGSMQGGINAPASPRWAWRGFVKDFKRDYVRYSGRAALYGEAPNPQIRTFQGNFTSLQCSSDNPIIKPECLWIGGFQMVEIYVYFGANYTLADPYYGRLYTIWTFEQ